MRTPSRLSFPTLLICVLSLLFATAKADAPPSYQVSKTFKIGGAGGWDYAKLDDAGQYLYLPRSNHTLVIDTATGKTVADIPGGQRLHGTALVPAVGHGFITDGGGAVVIVFDLKTNAVLGNIAAADDADGIIYDPASDHLFIACGDAGELLSIAANVDPKTGKADPPIDLGGKPEFLASDGHGKIYVNLANKAQLAVVDAKAMKVIAKYPTAPGTTPTGLAIDRDKGRLFIGCRNQKMIVMDARDGTILADLPIGRGVDATAFNAGTAFASCGDGTITAIQETSPGKFEVVQTVKTVVGARTMAVDQNTGTIYLPTADMMPAATMPTTNPTGRPPRPRPIPGTFKVVVVTQSPRP
jgi:DNA-binding beta-propeller fold protein YncE